MVSLNLEELRKSIRGTMCRRGVSEDKAEAILADVLPEIKRYIFSQTGCMSKEGSIIATSPRDVYRYAMEHLYNDPSDKREKAFLLFVDKKRRIREHFLLSLGGFCSTVIDEKVILSEMLRNNHTAVVLVHNHPGGDPTPSRADITQTDRLRKALCVFDFTLIDHVIVAEGSYYSFTDEISKKA